MVACFIKNIEEKKPSRGLCWPRVNKYLIKYVWNKLGCEANPTAFLFSHLLVFFLTNTVFLEELPRATSIHILSKAFSYFLIMIFIPTSVVSSNKFHLSWHKSHSLPSWKLNIIINVDSQLLQINVDLYLKSMHQCDARHS